MGQHFVPGEWGPELVGTQESHHQASGHGTANSQQWSDSHSEIHSETVTESTMETVVPFYEQREFRELSRRERYSLEEVREQLVAGLQRLPRQHAVVQLGRQPAQTVRIRTIATVPVRPSSLARLRSEVFRHCACAVPRAEVLADIDQRMRVFLEEYARTDVLALSPPDQPTAAPVCFDGAVEPVVE